MTTLINKRPQSLCAKFLIGVTLVTTLTAFPLLVKADENPIKDLYHTIVAKLHLSKVQIDNLMLVRKHAKHPEPLQAIMLQETQAGENVHSTGGCHGPFQIKTSTAVEFLKRDEDVREKYFGNSNPTPKLVASKLKHDMLFSIDVADGLYAGSLERSHSQSRAIMSYNRGDRTLLTERNPMKLKYVREVSAKIKNVVKPFNAIVARPVESDEPIQPVGPVDHLEVHIDPAIDLF